MSRRYSIKELCEGALRRIGSFSINDQAARGNELAETQRWLDLTIGHAAAKAKALWLVPKTISAILPTGVSSADMAALFGAQFPLQGTQFIVDAFIRTFQSAQPWQANTVYPPGAQVEPTVANGYFYQTAAGGLSGAREPAWPPAINGQVLDNAVLWAEAGISTGRDESLEILSRGEYDEIANKIQTGRPQKIHVDRLNQPTASWWPIVDPSLGISYQLNLTVQTFAPDVTGNPAGAHMLRDAWQLWAITETAAKIGAGPVRKLPTADIESIKSEAAALWLDLVGNENQEIARPRQTHYHDLG